jgi:cellobiose phosphorylase
MIRIHLEPARNAPPLRAGIRPTGERPEMEKENVIKRKPAKELAARFSTDAQFDQAMDQLKTYYDSAVHFQVKIRIHVCRELDIWNQYHASSPTTCHVPQLL